MNGGLPTGEAYKQFIEQHFGSADGLDELVKVPTPERPLRSGLVAPGAAEQLAKLTLGVEVVSSPESETQ